MEGGKEYRSMTPAVRDRAQTVLFMVGLTAAVMTIVTAIQLVTAGRVDRNRTAFLKRAVLDAAGVKCPPDTESMFALFDRTVSAEPPGSQKPVFYRVRETPEGLVIAVVFKRVGVGLWGKITAVVGLDADLHSMTGIVFIDQNETPGLGARIVEPWFCDQFRGKQAPFRFTPEGKSAGSGEINAITGATITTQGVKTMLEELFAEAPGMLRQREG
jgi:Na+-transporting NADH:ubiquinone oxidoreductase subunit C